MPTFTVVAGPNGSGKSTFTKIAREGFQDVPILDPDAVAVSMAFASESGGSAIDAAREVLKTAEELLESKQSFLVETTLSGNNYLRMMQKAKGLGFSVVLIFIGTSDVEINIERVRQRVSDGGHDVPEADQRRRYPRSMENLSVAFNLADEAVIFDNSKPNVPLRLAVKDKSGVKIYRTLPGWASFLVLN